MTRRELARAPEPDRVAMLVFNDFRSDSRVLKEARSLSAAGYRVQVLAIAKPDLPPQEAVHGFEVIRIRLDSWHLRLLRALRRNSPPGRPSSGFARSVRRAAAGAKRRAKRVVHDFLKPRLMRRHRHLSYWDYYRRASALLRPEPIRIFHAHDLNTLPLAWWLGRGRDRRVIYDSHELYLDRNRIPPRSWLGNRVVWCVEKLLAPRADGVITVNDSIAEILARRYRIDRPTVVVNAPDPSPRPTEEPLPDLRAICGTPSGTHLLLYVGGLAPHRGLENLIAALPFLPSCHLALMGPAWPARREQLGELASRLGVGARVTFVDPVPSDQVSRVAAAADLGVAAIENACLNHYLCSPNKLFEYLHAGLPVAVSDFPELRRPIEQFACGRTLDPADPESIARCISSMLADPEQLELWRANARRAAHHYTWSSEAAKLLEVYRSLDRTPSRARRSQRWRARTLVS